MSDLIIKSWDSYDSKKGSPYEYVLFSTDDVTVDDANKTAMVTLTQRSGTGRLYRNTPNDRALYYRKFQVEIANAEKQIDALLTLQLMMSTSDYRKKESSRKIVDSEKEWGKIYKAVDSFLASIEVEPEEPQVTEAIAWAEELVDSQAEALYEAPIVAVPEPIEEEMEPPLVAANGMKAGTLWQTIPGQCPNSRYDRMELEVEEYNGSIVFLFSLFSGDRVRPMRYRENDAIAFLDGREAEWIEI
jgi:hypothetical protein